MNTLDYPFIIRHLGEEEGGGFMIEFPDLAGCMSDGDSIEEAIANGQDALKCWIAAARKANRKIPKPRVLSKQSGKWLQRVPKSLHLKLVERAKLEGVSLNTLVVSLLAQSLGNDSHHTQKKRVS
ncbi:MAG: type II toxin-antitoxin system HicB family antitoxin [Pseudomonadota bacterium]